ncbi:hypothetical protein [Pleionea litopenaei]|uniref:Uncharacterized protein n=1 Tax=Pleionea litopenaei TaxID=3070815 RepID=A0AA51RS62_9GAMM|nr:hypothetical protein [Pleionea sp. HL-JVS1]WMS86611.1 hypothetical protein Q9312_15425 [Pleionea sp. HL-JVS1]
MKKYLKNIIIVAGSCACLSVLASDVTIPNSFSAGTPARASEVNDNFNAVKAAVDDNDARITTNSNNISTNAANISTNSDAIALLNQVSNKIYPVNIAAFNNAGYPNLRMNSSGLYNTVDLTDIVQAPVILPDGATVTGMNCLVRDNHNTANFNGGSILLMRVSVLEGAPPGVYQSMVDIDLTTSGNLNGLRSLTDEDGVIENTVIDNATYMYYVRFWIQRTEAVSNLMISGCRIQYQI